MFRLIYTSRLMQRMNRPEFEALCSAAAKKNQKAKVSGLLLFNGSEFLQCLEGPSKNEVAEIYRSIVLDDRHQDIRLLLSQNVPELIFKDWPMHGLMARQAHEHNHHQPYQFLDQRLERPWATLGSGAIGLVYEYAKVKEALEYSTQAELANRVFDAFDVELQAECHQEDHSVLGH